MNIDWILTTGILALLFLLWYDRRNPLPKPKAEHHRLACVGDSITWGDLVPRRRKNAYPAVLQRLLGRGWTVGNFGVNGHTLQKTGDKPYWNHEYFVKLRNFAPTTLVLMLGTNDTKTKNWQGLDRFLSDYREMVAVLAELPSHPRIILMSPPAQFLINTFVFKYDMDRDRAREITLGLKTLSQELNLEFIDLFHSTEDHPEFFPIDGIHIGIEGGKHIAREVYQAIKG